MCKNQDNYLGNLCPVGLVAGTGSFQVTNPGILKTHKKLQYFPIFQSTLQDFHMNCRTMDFA